MNLPPGVPKALKFGAVSFPVFATADGRLGFRHKDGSRWKQCIRKNLPALRADAERIALAILNAETAAGDMSAEDRRIYIAARAALAPHSLAVDAAARLVSDAAAAAGNVSDILPACHAYTRTGSARAAEPAAALVAHFVRFLAADGVSPLYLRQMECDCKAFAARFPAAINTVRVAELEEWLRALPVGLRRRRNLRDKLVALFNFARVHEYLPATQLTEAEKIKRPKVERKAPSIFTPSELSRIIAATQEHRPDFLPYLVIGAFAGLRSSEARALQWRHIHWADRVIEVGEEHKTGFRLVAMRDNLLAWLAPWRDASGPVCHVTRPDHVMRALFVAAGIEASFRQYANALRHSAATYSVALDQNMAATAIQLGHSVAELRKSYNRASLKSAAAAWFSIAPTPAANVVRMRKV